MATPPSFRVSADVVAAWKEVLSANRAVRGVEPVLKEVLGALLAQSTDGYVTIERHKVFSWAEALRGAATRADAAGATTLTRAADDMKSYLGASAPASAPLAISAYAPPPAPSTSFQPAPAVTYSKAAAVAIPGAASAAPVRLVAEGDLPTLVAQLLREARGEVIVVAPWNGGLDSLVKDLVIMPPGVALRIITRRATVEDEAWHRGLQDLRRRNADLVISPFLHTRCIIVDGQKLLLGAAGAPVALSKEMALYANDAGLANEARLNVGRLWQEARDGR
ncbi:MAG: hypothetical protein WDA16_03280 [Candidatus Thermoplasmatota archaeon]